MNVVDRLLTTAEVKLKGLDIIFLRASVGGQAPHRDKSRAHEVVINTVDKRIWIIDSWGVPVECEIKVKDKL